MSAASIQTVGGERTMEDMECWRTQESSGADQAAAGEAGVCRRSAAGDAGELKGLSPARVRAAVRLSREYAQEKKVPLTAERLAASLHISEARYRRIVSMEQQPPPGGEKVVALLCAADAEATASVIEHAMTRGTSVNMHLLYLRKHAGYAEKGAEAAAVRFTGEEQI